MEDFNIETWEKLWHEAERLEASDLHIAAGQPVFLRVDGELRRLELPFPSAAFLHGLIEKIASEKQLAYLMRKGNLIFRGPSGKEGSVSMPFISRGSLRWHAGLYPKVYRHLRT